MINSFAKEFDNLFKFVASHDTSPDDEPWFFKEVKQLINQHGNEVAIAFAQKESWPEYKFELLVKSGLRGIKKEILLPYLNTENEDNVYCTAFCLAGCGYQEGFDILKAFANQTHPLSKNTHPIADILPDLEYITDERTKEINSLCEKYL